MTANGSNRVAAWAVMICAASLLTPFVARADEPVDPAQWAPDNTFMFVGTSNCNSLVDAFKKTAGYRMFNDPKLEAMTEPYSKLTDAVLKQLAGMVGLENAEELKVYPQGPAALFLTLAPPPAEGEDPEFAIIVAMDMGENADKAGKLVRKMTKSAMERGARKEMEKVLSAKIVTLHLPTDEDEEPGEVDEHQGAELAEALEGMDLHPTQQDMLVQALSNMPEIEQISYCMDETRLIIGSSAKDVSRSLRCVRGRTRKTLARSKAGELLNRKCPEGSHVRMLINVPMFVEMIELTEPEAKQASRAWGADGLGPAVASVRFAPEPGVESRLNGFWEVSAEKQGLPAILRMANAPVVPPATVSAAAAVYGTVQLNPKALAKEIIESISRADPEAGEAIKAGMQTTMPDGTVMDVQAQVLDHLSGPLCGQLVLAKPYDADNVGVHFSLGHANRQAVEKLFALPMTAAMFEKRELLGNTLYGPLMFPMMGVSLAVTENVMAVGSTKQLERFIRAEGKSGPSLADDPMFKRVAGKMPKDGWLVVYADSARVYDAQIAIHRAGDATVAPQLPFGGSVVDGIRYGLVQNFQGADLKDPEALREYQGAEMVTVRTEPDGLSLESVSIVQQQEK
jgi:hypothetical protein